MDLKRFFSDTPILGDTATLTGKEFIHAVKAVRLKVGYKLILCDNTPYDFYCTVTDIGKTTLTVSVDKKVSNDTEIDTDITLYIGMNKDLDTVVQKAVEMGVKKVVPFSSQHCNVDKVNTERLRSIVWESSKQCGRSLLTVIEEPISFDEMLLRLQKNVFFFYEFERDRRVCDSTVAPDQPCSVVIGCEGGFSEQEAARLSETALPYTLGKRILRVSTAVVAACTLLNERLGAL